MFELLLSLSIRARRLQQRCMCNLPSQFHHRIHTFSSFSMFQFISKSSPFKSQLILPLRKWHDRSQVPRIYDDRRKAMNKIKDIGYYYRYHRPGIDELPRLPDCREPLHKPKYKVREAWRESQARFGENDYIDLLGDGRLHPAQLLYHVPRWLRGFPGQQRANELVKLIHYRNLYKSKLEQNAPHKWHQLCKRINYLLTMHNYRKQDELRAERHLGLWEEQPDFFYKDKQRRSYKDLA